MHSTRSDRQGARVAVVGVVGVPGDPRGEWFVEAAATVRHPGTRWELFDDRGGAGDAVSVAEGVVADGGFSAVVAGLPEEESAERSEAALRLYRKAGLPVLLPLATGPGPAAASDDTVLRMYPADRGQVAAITRVCEERGLRRLAVLHDGGERGRRLAERLIGRTAGAGGVTGAVTGGVTGAGGVAEADSTELVAEAYEEWPPGESPGAVVLCGTPSGMADLLRGAPAAPHQLVILTDDCDLPASDRTVVVARPVGGGATRVAAAFVALGGALAKHPERRGAALLETVRGELAVPTGPRGDIPQHGWQVRPRRPLSRPSGPATAGHHEFAVLGGGMVGRAAAAELAEAGASVVLVDDGTPGSSASAVSGGLVRAFELDEGERNLACEAFLALWGRPELATAHGFRRTGALVLLGPADVAKAAVSVSELNKLGVSAEMVSVSGLRSRWPDLRTAGLAGAVWEPGAGYVRGPVAMAALLDRARLAGVRVLPRHRVDSLTADTDGTAVLTWSAVGEGDRGDDRDSDRDSDRAAAHGELRVDVALVAAGCATPSLLGDRWPADRPAASKLIRYGIFELGGRRLPTVVDGVTGSWARPDGVDGLLAGFPLAAPWNAPAAPATIPDDRQVRWIRDGLSPRLPFLAEASLLTGSSGTDLFVDGGLPALGPLPGLPHTVVAAGWSGAGFKTAPAAARRAATAAVQLLEGQRNRRT
ncbi:FAD-dependent oxidoreductase [Streptomyces niveus]|uniref:FAD-dependent oxidoreductase n=1 Tax=Streptomyces niveus TaxID=193462 RepID=A0ABZ1ZY22_STRNV|nr:FAD-dependent oxidoreductase [Streptomyces niveus]